MRTVRSIGSREKSKIRKEMERKMQPQNARAVSSHITTNISWCCSATPPPRELHVRRMLSKYPAEVHETILHTETGSLAHSLLAITSAWFLPVQLFRPICMPPTSDCIIWFSSAVRGTLWPLVNKMHTTQKRAPKCVCATMYTRRLVNCRVWFRLNRLGVWFQSVLLQL